MERRGGKGVKRVERGGGKGVKRVERGGGGESMNTYCSVHV